MDIKIKSDLAGNKLYKLENKIPCFFNFLTNPFFQYIHDFYFDPLRACEQKLLAIFDCIFCKKINLFIDLSMNYLLN